MLLERFTKISPLHVYLQNKIKPHIRWRLYYHYHQWSVGQKHLNTGLHVGFLKKIISNQEKTKQTGQKYIVKKRKKCDVQSYHPWWVTMIHQWIISKEMLYTLNLFMLKHFISLQRDCIHSVVFAMHLNEMWNEHWNNNISMGQCKKDVTPVR